MAWATKPARWIILHSIKSNDGPPFVMAAAGFIISGLVPTDAAVGYPPGEPSTATLAGRIHQGAGILTK